MEQKCALCTESTDLKMSHIVPKFVFKYLKNTSLTGKFRDPNNFKHREQDGPKYKLLCGDCEQLFSESEKYFAENVFNPYVKNRNVSFKYNFNLMYYIESVHWRFLLTRMSGMNDHEKPVFEDIEIAVRSKLRFIKGEEIVKVILEVNNANYPNRAYHSIFAIDEDILHTFSFGHFPMKRMIMCDYFFHKERLYIYSYYCGLVISSFYNCSIFAFLNPFGYRILDKGEFKLKYDKGNDPVCRHILFDKNMECHELLSEVNEKDRATFKKIIDEAEKKSQ